MLGGLGGTLSVTRSLARAGIRVYVLGDSSSPARFSRHCHSFVDLGTEAGVHDRWLEWLERGPRGAVVLTCHDDGLELVATRRDWLVERGYLPPEADDEVLLAMLDKQRTYELARQVGVPAPRTWAVTTPADLDAVGEDISYPCALKPRHSHLYVRSFDAKLVTVGSEPELRAELARTSAAGLEMIVTEVIPGRHDQHFSYYTYLDGAGEPLFHFTKRKLRQYPAGWGLGCYHGVDWNPEVAELGLRLLQAIGVRGLATPEFKRDSRDGLLKLIEVNHRFTAANELVRAAGIDLALIAYNRAVGRPTPGLNGYRRGGHLWYPLQDARAFVAYRRRGELTTREWLRSLARRQHPALFAWDDPLPSVANVPLKLASRLHGRVAAQ
jgi:D-aspartate ligase